MTQLWLLRHAPVLAEAGLCYGASDLPAAAAQTREAAQRFARSLPAGVLLCSSPLARCAALAHAVAAQQRSLVAPVFDARLAEMDFGDWEGRPWGDIPRAELDAWTGDFADARAGGDGESVRAFMERVGAAWDAWQAGGRDAAWVTHAGVIRAALLLQQGVRCPRSAAEWPAQAIGFGEWRVLTLP